jgi:septal ring factor EnvC (AmiA/AmiB activator)
LIGRLVMAQVTGVENLLDRLQVCAGTLSHPVAGKRPLEMADSVVTKVKEVQARIGELEETASQLANSRQEADSLRRELQDARQESGAAQQQAEAQVAALQNSVAAGERRLAGYESKTFGAIAKRALQVALDTFQILTPRPLRSAVRKYYLNWFYFRIYPERRPVAAQSRES